jgi:argininosuccinate synthase
MVQAAADHGSTAIAHGSTGAGNDQVRFDVAIQVLSRSMLGREIDVVAPIRSLGLTRAASTDYLLERGFDVPSETTAYSINRGLWGTTIGGEETLTTQRPLPEDAYPDTVPPKEAPDEAVELEIRFEQGLPVAVDGQGMDGVALVEHLNDVGGAHGVGRDIHVGDTILGIKGRVGFEAPAAEVLLTAHRELEKLVLSKWQQVKKDEMARFYGMLLHEGQYFDPVMRDIEAHLLSSQAAVSGTVTLELYKGSVSVLGADSPNSLFNADLATYGEENALWNGRDAEGFTRLAGVPSLLAAAPGAGASPASPPLASITGPSVTPISG